MVIKRKQENKTNEDEKNKSQVNKGLLKTGKWHL